MGSNDAPKSVSVLGIISLVFGIIGTILSAIPCMFVVGMPVGGLGLLLGLIGLAVSIIGKSQGVVLPILGTVFSLLALAIGGAWIGFGAYAVNEANKQIEADRKAVREATAPVAVTASELRKKYSENMMTADGKYKGQILEISGQVSHVNEFGLSPEVLLKADGGQDVKCAFDQQEVNMTRGLMPGQQVKIRGKCDGLVLGQLTLKHCITK